MGRLGNCSSSGGSAIIIDTVVVIVLKEKTELAAFREECNSFECDDTDAMVDFDKLCMSTGRKKGVECDISWSMERIADELTEQLMHLS